MKTIRFNLSSFAMWICVLTVLHLSASAQTGWNGVVFSPSGNNIVPAASYALVDATQFGGSDLCQMISNAFGSFNSTTSGGIVVDARGVASSALDCSQSGVNPWDGLLATNATTTFSNIVLLPAGSIQISRSWVLPNSTRLIGEGPQVTTIAWAGGTNYPDMIDMGYQGTPLAKPICSNGAGGVAPDCLSIVIEHLGLSGGGSAANGIFNCCSQERAQVRDVFITGVGTGLTINDKFAQNSGPYTDITMTNVTKCLAIGPGDGFPVPNTRVIQGLKCSATASPAITIDGSNNRLEDVSISGSLTDGILIGNAGPAPSNALFNIRGSGVGNVIHISNATHSDSLTSGCPYFGSSSSDNACDITLAGITRSGGTNTIWDELNGAIVKDQNVGLYVLGERVLSSSGNPTKIGYSQFTTATFSGNTNAPGWLVGSNTPDQSSSCAVGSIYSCTGTCTGGALWECRNSATPPWKAIQ